MAPAKHSHDSHGRATGAKPPPRKVTCVGARPSTGTSTIGHLPVGDLCLGTNMRPQLLVQAVKIARDGRTTAFAARNGNGDDLTTAAGQAAMDDDGGEHVQ